MMSFARPKTVAVAGACGLAKFRGRLPSTSRCSRKCSVSSTMASAGGISAMMVAEGGGGGTNAAPAEVRISSRLVPWNFPCSLGSNRRRFPDGRVATPAPAFLTRAVLSNVSFSSLKNNLVGGRNIFVEDADNGLNATEKYALVREIAMMGNNFIFIV